MPPAPPAAVLTAPLLPKAEAALAGADAVMARLIAANPPCKLARRQPPFHVLTTSIVNQQLSQSAAATICRRIADLAPTPWSAENMAQAPDDKLRAAGLSRQKIRYIRHLQEAAAAGVFAPAAMRNLSDAEIIARLTAISGVGVWTAEMFLMFGLRRPDVVSLGDAGLRRAARLHYGKRLRGEDAEILEKAARKWRPWRTVACWHLWRSLKTKAAR